MKEKMIFRITLYFMWIFSVIMVIVSTKDVYIAVMWIANIGIILNERIK